MKRLFIHALAVTLLCSCANEAPEWPLSFLGDAAPLNMASQTIVIKPDTKWANVTGGDIVRFDSGGKSFAWAFNVANSVTWFDLNRVAPPGFLDRPLNVYIAPDPRYIGGDGHSRL